jgi:hypothetical protein
MTIVINYAMTKLKGYLNMLMFICRSECNSVSGDFNILSHGETVLKI